MFEVRAYMWISMFDDDFETILSTHSTLADAEAEVAELHVEHGIFAFIVDTSD